MNKPIGQMVTKMKQNPEASASTSAGAGANTGGFDMTAVRC